MTAVIITGLALLASYLNYRFLGRRQRSAIIFSSAKGGLWIVDFAIGVVGVIALVVLV